MSTTPPSEHHRDKKWNVSLTREQWCDALLLLQCIPMPGSRYQRIIDSIQVQTSRMREEP